MATNWLRRRSRAAGTPRKQGFRPHLLQLEDRCVPAAALALSNNALLAFDTAAPSSVTSTPVTGLVGSDNLVGIDFRPQNGLLYGLGYNATAGSVQLYSISVRTGLATAIGGPLTPTTGRFGVDANTQFGLDFNPAVDRLRIVNNVGQNFRINPNDGALVVAALDAPISGATSVVDATAYTNNFPNNGAITTQYTLDAASNGLFIQSPPNNGTQIKIADITLNGSALDFTAVNGFDINGNVVTAVNNAPVTSGTGLAVLSVNGTSGLYSINLVTGAATLVGTVGTGTSPIQGLAVQDTNALDNGTPLIGLNSTGTQLLRFSSATPANITSVTIGAITTGETLVAIDFRPATGQLFALGINGTANTGTLYRLDPQTGAVTVIGTASGIAFVDAMGGPIDLPDAAVGYGLDFNPTVDRIRVTTGNGVNFRINPNNGAAVDGNATAAGVQTDAAINGLPAGSLGVSATAYTNSFGQALTTPPGPTSQYTLDAVSNQLFIQNPPNTGTQIPVASVTLDGAPLDFTDVNGFEIVGTVRVTTAGAVAQGQGLAALTVGGVTGLYSIDLTTGAATFLGPIGAGATSLMGLTAALPALAPATPIIVGAGANAAPTVQLFNGDGTVRSTLNPYGTFFRGGVSVASADVNGDGVNETITAVASAGPAHVKVFDGLTGSELASFFAFDPSFTGGLNIAGGDINGDGRADIIVGVASGASPHVKVFDGTQLTQVGTNGVINSSAELASFFAFGGTFTGGVSVATGDVNGDGVLDIITGAGVGASPHVKVIDGTQLGQVQSTGEIAASALLGSFFAYSPTFFGGITVSTADFNGDGLDDIVTGAGAGSPAHVKVINATQLGLVQPTGEIQAAAQLASFFAFDPSFVGGVKISTGDRNADGTPDIYAAAGSGLIPTPTGTVDVGNPGPRIAVVNGTQLNQVDTDGEILTSALLDSFFAGALTTRGIFVA